MTLRLALLCVAVACGSPTPEPTTDPAKEPAADGGPPAESKAKAGVIPAPEVAFDLPGRSTPSPGAHASTPELDAVKAILRGVVEAHALDPDNPWALSHAIVALGADAQLEGGVSVVDHLFTEFAVLESVGSEVLVDFPRKRGDVRIEPHTDLILKAMVERGVKPSRQVTVQGKQLTVGHLYRQSLRTAWVDGANTSGDSYNDMPWTLQALATWAPPGLAWTSDSGRSMTMDALTGAVVDKLGQETLFLRQAMAQGQRVQKRGQGIFAYTCGGAHLVQGAGYAVARGFGTDAHRKIASEQLSTYLYRAGIEMPQVDAAMKQHPEYKVQLITQRLKFLGHLLETSHKLAALGLAPIGDNEAHQLGIVEQQLAQTVHAIDGSSMFSKLGELREVDEQLYLDLVGDAAHALRGLDLATGASVSY